MNDTSTSNNIPIEQIYEAIGKLYLQNYFLQANYAALTNRFIDLTAQHNALQELFNQQQQRQLQSLPSRPPSLGDKKDEQVK